MAAGTFAGRYGGGTPQVCGLGLALNRAGAQWGQHPHATESADMYRGEVNTQCVAAHSGKSFASSSHSSVSSTALRRRSSGRAS
jgi:hypothetical protein